MSQNANKHGAIFDTRGSVCEPVCDSPLDRVSELRPTDSPLAVSSPPGRDGRGRFAPGNTIGAATYLPPGTLAAVQHGLDAKTLPPEFAHLATDVEAFVAGALADEGDEADVTTRRRSLLNYRARLHRRILQLDAAIELRGLFDKRGKLRLAWLQRLEGLIGSAKALDALLGLERRQKRVPSLGEVLDGE